MLRAYSIVPEPQGSFSVSEDIMATLTKAQAGEAELSGALALRIVLALVLSAASGVMLLR